MKRQIITFKIIFLFIFFLSFLSKAYGTIESDDCEACHGLFPGMMEEVRPGEPQKFLLQNTICLNCHSDQIPSMGGEDACRKHTVKPDKPLAGGNFHYVAKALATGMA
jgi:hypothetical protein